jgi:hypothetical protein
MCPPLLAAYLLSQLSRIRQLEEQLEQLLHHLHGSDGVDDWRKRFDERMAGLARHRANLQSLLSRSGCALEPDTRRQRGVIHIDDGTEVGRIQALTAHLVGPREEIH